MPLTTAFFPKRVPFWPEEKARQVYAPHAHSPHTSCKHTFAEMGEEKE